MSLVDRINKLKIEGEITSMSRVGCTYSFYITIWEYKITKRKKKAVIVKTVKDLHIDKEKVENLLKGILPNGNK